MCSLCIFKLQQSHSGLVSGAKTSNLTKYCHTVIGCVLCEIKTICQNCPCFFPPPLLLWKLRWPLESAAALKLKTSNQQVCNSSIATRSDLLLIEVITRIHVIKNTVSIKFSLYDATRMPLLAVSTIILCIQLKSWQWILNVQESPGASCFQWSSRRCCCSSFSGVHLSSIQLIGHDPERLTPA